ncbi:MAG TPA: hypothetical protein VL096_22335, partial [Pirellulaceae bacterium]|nr:hypothetical protein [Pirellulaceae bacterium]
VAQAQPDGYPERGVQYTQPVDPYAASRGAARPAPQQPNGQPANPNAWAPSPTSAPPAGYAPAADPRAAAPANNAGYPARGAEAQKGAYDANGYPQRDPVNLKSAYRPELPSGSNAYVEGTPYRDPRGEGVRGSQYEAHTFNPEGCLPAVEVGRPTQSEASNSVYGQPAKPANNPYATDLPRRDVRLNDNAAYGYGQQQPPAQQPPAQQPRRDEPQPGFQSNPLANQGQGAIAEGRVDANRQPAGAPVAAAENPPLAMEGYCSVGLIETGKWSKGDVRFGAIHRGRTYLFSSAADQQKFLVNPDKYSPMLSGYDPVKYLEQGQLVDGKRQHGIFHEGHTYLFADEASLDRFCKQPQAFTNSVRQAMQQGGAATNVRR